MWRFSQLEFPGKKGLIKTWKRFLVFLAPVGVVALSGAACGDGDSADKINTNDDGHTHATDTLDTHAVEGAHQVRPLRPSDVGQTYANGRRYYREQKGSRGSGYCVGKSRSLPCWVPDEQVAQIVGAIALPEAWMDRVLAKIHLADEVNRIGQERLQPNKG